MKMKTLLLVCLLTTKLFAQNLISPVTISLPTNPPANTVDWATAVPPVLLTAKGALQNGQLNGMVQESKILVTIKKGGSKICGRYTASSAPNAGFNSITKVWTGAAVLGFLGQDCSLAPGDYELCVLFLSLTGQPLSTEVCKPFTIKDTKQITYSPPQNVQPTAEKKLTEMEAKAVSFRWTPLVPKPQQPVTYRLKVWQLMQGQNGTQVMRTNPPIVTKDVDNITQAVVTDIYTGPCRPPYLCDYIWNVEAIMTNTQGQTEILGKSEPTTFNIASTVTPQTATLSNVYPENKKTFKETEAKAPINFRWTPLVPKPQEPVTYRLRVWQLMQGQNSTQAMRTNKPIVTKDVADITEASISGIYTGPCRPPYLCDYVWNVEALNKQGTVVASSEPSGFTSSSNSGCSHKAKIKSIECLQIVNGLQQYNVCVEYKNDATVGCSDCTILLNNPNNYPGIGGGGITIVSTNPSTTINSIATGVPSTLTAGNQTTICFTASVATGNNLKFQVHATCNDAFISQPEIDRNHENSIFDTIPPSCKCTTCDQITFNVGQETSTFNPGPKPWLYGDNNHLYLTQPITVGPSSINVVQVKAEVVDFYWYTENEDCKKCNNNTYYWGNLIRGTTNATGFNPSGTPGTDDAGVPLPNSHEMQFMSIATTGAAFNGNLNLQLTVPPQTELPCCTDCFRFCIRYTIVFKENGICKVCTKVKCYEVKRQHRKSMFIMYPPPNACGDPGVIIWGDAQQLKKTN
jgi:hypothetical protein